MYAIIVTGGKQYRVSPEETVTIEKLPAQPGEQVVFDRVALVEQEGAVQVGTPWVEGARVTGRVVAHGRDKKVGVFTYRSKGGHKREKGHRQAHTRVRVEGIELGGQALHPADAPAQDAEGQGDRDNGS